jgi:hypothetical protein
MPRHTVGGPPILDLASVGFGDLVDLHQKGFQSVRGSVNRNQQSGSTDQLGKSRPGKQQAIVVIVVIAGSWPTRPFLGSPGHSDFPARSFDFSGTNDGGDVDGGRLCARCDGKNE